MKLHKPLDEAVYDKAGNEVPQVNTIDNPLYYNECRSCRNFFDENLLGFLSLALIFFELNLLMFLVLHEELVAFQKNS